jgi:4-amino-4-deoxy-L-arabinose transferase-like glycosyltransferase
MHMPETTTASRSTWFWDGVLLLVVVGTLLGYGLGERALWEPDEGRYSEIPREMVLTGDYVTPRINGVKYFEKPPLFYWAQAGAIHVLGLNEWALRLWPALFALFGVLTVYVAGRRLFDRRTGLFAASVLATSLMYFYLGRTITLDMAVSVLLSAGLLAFLLGTRASPGPRRRWLMWTFYVCAALATLTKGLIGIVIPVSIIGTWMLLLHNWRVLQQMYLPSGLALFLIIAAPWHILVSVTNPEFPNFYFIHEHLLRFTTRINQRYEPMWFFLPVLLVGWLPWVAFLGQALRFNLPSSWAARQEHSETLFLNLWAGLVFVFFSLSDSKLWPYILPMFPPVALLLGRYFAHAWSNNRLRGLRTGYWAVLGMGIALAAILSGEPRPGVGFAQALEHDEVLGFYRYAGAVIAAAGGIVSFLLGMARFRLAFISLILSSVAFLTVLGQGLPLMDSENSSKTLALRLKPLLGPDTEVMSYHHYYEDLPVYLERRVTVVDYKGELEFGAEHENVTGWMIDEETFWQRWQSPATVYMLTRRSAYDQLAADHRGRFILLGEVGKNVLLTNNGTPP